MRVQKFYIDDCFPLRFKEGDTVYTKYWESGENYRFMLPPGTCCKVVYVDSGLITVITKGKVDIDRIEEDLIDMEWGGEYECIDEYYDCEDEYYYEVREEAYYRAEILKDDIFLIDPDNLEFNPGDISITVSKDNYLPVINKEVFSKSPKERTPLFKKLRFHKLSKLLKEKTRGFLAKASGFFKSKEKEKIDRYIISSTSCAITYSTSSAWVEF